MACFTIYFVLFETSVINKIVREAEMISSELRTSCWS